MTCGEARREPIDREFLTEADPDRHRGHSENSGGLASRADWLTFTDTAALLAGSN